jgi:hypothetical protein
VATHVIRSSALGALLALALSNLPAAIAAGAPAGGASPFDGAHWIWSAPTGDAREPDVACHLAVEFTLAAAPTKATAWVSADNHFRLFVDGREAATATTGRSRRRSRSRRSCAPA